MYRLICPECSGLQRRKTYDSKYKCIRCDTTQKPLSVIQELIKSTQGLLKLGIKLSAVHTYEIHNRGNIRNEICFCLMMPYPENILHLPDGWRVSYDVSGTYPVYELRSSYEQRNINALEDWIKNKDVMGFKAILRLAGYL